MKIRKIATIGPQSYRAWRNFEWGALMSGEMRVWIEGMLIGFNFHVQP